MYRWLNPKIITHDYLQINYLFTDWSKLDSTRREGYPMHKIMTQDFELMSLEETERFIKGKLDRIDKYKNEPQKNLPFCTPEELWQKDSVFKYYKNPTSLKRSTKNFDNAHDANARLVADGHVGIVVEQKGEIKFCRYCSANTVCTQKDQYILDGTLKI